MENPFKVVRDFEAALAEYTGARYVVAVNSCTAALELALLWYAESMVYSDHVLIPRRTYPSVPMAVKRAGLWPVFDDRKWVGGYRLDPTDVWDYAKRLKDGMYVPWDFQCLSFHPQKPLGLSNGGGAILHDSPEADPWLRRMRFDGRTEGVPTREDHYREIGLHCYMMPPTAAEGLQRLAIYARTEHEDQPSELELYPDLTKYEVFRERTTSDTVGSLGRLVGQTEAHLDHG